jgi:hypothetical protein
MFGYQIQTIITKNIRLQPHFAVPDAGGNLASDITSSRVIRAAEKGSKNRAQMLKPFVIRFRRTERKGKIDPTAARIEFAPNLASKFARERLCNCAAVTRRDQLCGVTIVGYHAFDHVATPVDFDNNTAAVVCEGVP